MRPEDPSGERLRAQLITALMNGARSIASRTPLDRMRAALLTTAVHELDVSPRRERALRLARLALAECVSRRAAR